ncbi:hypothetical protein AVEN_262564-1 [Araneus ventricosus]|uniref:Uncharacterized protein n=1 Tax=Araneus ventricosus TaxID=182803 RepID=A0A4Y2K2H8_ARAVE|nr:hypothetical protein AVEN_262564-1 [Araneus ventricosus]
MAYFSASTNRWEVLLKYSPLALKKESDTRWSSRREPITVVHKHLVKIVEAVNLLALDAVSSPKTKSGAVSLLKGLTAQIKDCTGTIVNEVLEEAKHSCLALNPDPSFKEVRKRKKKRFFEEKCDDESSEISQH